MCIRDRLWTSPNKTLDQVLAEYAKHPTWYPRAFKTHAAIGQDFVEYSPDRKFIVVMRNPLDAAASLVHFLHAQNPELLELWNATNIIPKFPTASAAWTGPFIGAGAAPITFIKSFWPYRNEPNVLVLHYNDMLKDHRATVSKVARFMGVDMPISKFENVLEYTTYTWMKAHAGKFAAQHVMDLPMMRADGMIRKGSSGEGKAVEEELRAAFEAKMSVELSSEQAQWMMSGGEEHLANTAAEAKEL
eukprot:TRINITY_DN33821_c0_g1_i4.p1 TRINITY_DN33821_c0_g1~~TRINITY_DN33821_c0_g1_i4.p1  ORF type:complete len:246 (+),score=51.72 TRINITY_DN33821_c0_g1_i4:78-815(+)